MAAFCKWVIKSADAAIKSRAPRGDEVDVHAFKCDIILGLMAAARLRYSHSPAMAAYWHGWSCKACLCGYKSEWKQRLNNLNTAL